MKVSTLNLSRKWRSQNFDQIIGQDIAVRILQNSLYLGQYFPVYLFAGQRGCGKTSTARVFAAAINCQFLDNFQKDPKKFPVPCLVCPSCVLMRDGNHPDFIEIDAASHTGVDNIRTIIESSMLLPLVGRKRVYLIDEAHMLSKAAFNAALKILEEPSPTALFILATTNHYKIIDTVRSRCFQLFFNAIAQEPLCNHLEDICKKEGIKYEPEALRIIASQTDGSARDALNLLEQVRFATSVITQASVLKILGHISDQQIVSIIDVTLSGSATELLSLMVQLEVTSYSADYIWQRLMMLLRALIWLKHGINPDSIVASTSVLLKKIEKKHALADILGMVDVLYKHEEIFLKTKTQHVLLEMALLLVCRSKKKLDNGGHNSEQQTKSTEHFFDVIQDNVEDESIDNEQNGAMHTVLSSEHNDSDGQDRWMSFVSQAELIVYDPVVKSVLRQAFFVSSDDKQVCIDLPKDLIFFQDTVQAAHASWQPLLETIFGLGVLLQFNFSLTRNTENGVKKNSVSKITQPVTTEIEQKQPVQVQQNPPYKFATHYVKMTQKPSQKQENYIDVSDETKWKIAPMLLRNFPGIITEVRENR